MEYSKLVECYEKIDSTTKRLEKTEILANLIAECNKDEIDEIILLLQGKIFPEWDERKIGVAARTIIKAMSLSWGISIDKIEKEWKKTGDLGISAENLAKEKKQSTLFSSKLDVKKVFHNLSRLAEHEGQGTNNQKVQTISELLTSASPNESRYIVRTILGELRVGASQGTIRDSIISAYFSEIYNKRDNEMKEEYRRISEKVQNAYNLTNDFSEIIKKIDAKGEEGFDEIDMTMFKPVNPMLFPKAKNIEDGFKVVGKPAIIEYKYDGFRVQIHKEKDKVQLFTRRLENVTKQFPDVVSVVQERVDAERCILDSEILGIDSKTKRMLPFQNISQRIRRKHEIESAIKDIPVVVVVFDILKNEDNNMLEKEFESRRKTIERVVKEKKGVIELSKSINSEDIEESNEFYQESLLLGHEGIMMKSLSREYRPGARIGYAVKVKPVLEPLDLAIIGAEWGKGKRVGWLTSYTLACTDDNNNFLEMGKVGTGVKELETDGDAVTFGKLTEMLKPLIVDESNSSVSVKPEVIVEVDYEEIQKSENYRAGFALRFPRIKRIRTDLKEASNLEDVKKIYNEQRGRGE
ncbi:MAG: ATP-dependent DNA ligase [Nanoarchaeota archaeon]